MPDVPFSRETTYTGRNGTGRCVGVSVFRYADTVSLHPVNSKGNTANCEIEIPLADLDAVITALTAAKNRQNIGWSTSPDTASIRLQDIKPSDHTPQQAQPKRTG